MLSPITGNCEGLAIMSAPAASPALRSGSAARVRLPASSSRAPPTRRSAAIPSQKNVLQRRCEQLRFGRQQRAASGDSHQALESRVTVGCGKYELAR